MSADDRPLLLTGAAGRLGRVLAAGLAAHGWRLRLTDIAAFPDPLPPGACFTRADLAEAASVAGLAQGCRAILHFGGVSTEAAYAALAGPNFAGLHAIYEAARAADRARVVFASSNHAFGFHARSERLDSDAAYRPDSLYGLSKAFGELAGRYYWDRHGIETVSIRIGTCRDRPHDERSLATWLSYRDLIALVERAVEAPQVGVAVVWGASANARGWWRGDDRARIGWTPADSADGYAASVAPEPPDGIAARHQGGSMCTRERR